MDKDSPEDKWTKETIEASKARDVEDYMPVNEQELRRENKLIQEARADERLKHADELEKMFKELEELVFWNGYKHFKLKESLGYVRIKDKLIKNGREK